MVERQALEQTLRRSEQELADFFNHAPMALHWIGPDGIILRANEAELRLLGYTRDEYLGHHIAEFHADQARDCGHPAALACRRRAQDYEARLVCKDGTIKHVLLNANVLWEQGQFIHTRCFTRDITERKRGEETGSAWRRLSTPRMTRSLATPGGHHHQLEPGRGTALWVQPGRSHWPATHPPGAARLVR